MARSRTDAADSRRRLCDVSSIKVALNRGECRDPRQWRCSRDRPNRGSGEREDGQDQGGREICAGKQKRARRSRALALDLSIVLSGAFHMSRRALAMIVLAMVALLFAGTSAATAASKPQKKRPTTRTVVRSPPQPPDTQTGSRSQGM